MLIYPMSAEKSPKIISVTGAHSNIGKTTLCSMLLKNLKGFGAIKFTKTTLYVTIIEDINILKQQYKDTAVFLNSGAEKVLWIQSPYSGLKDVLEIALGRMSDLKGVIIEGNSPVDFLNPHLVVFIINEEGTFKPSAFKACKEADAVIINSGKQIKLPSFVLGKYPKDAKFFRIDLAKNKGDINEFLSFVKERISGRAH